MLTLVVSTPVSAYPGCPKYEVIWDKEKRSYMEYDVSFKGGVFENCVETEDLLESPIAGPSGVGPNPVTVGRYMGSGDFFECGGRNYLFNTYRFSSILGKDGKFYEGDNSCWTNGSDCDGPERIFCKASIPRSGQFIKEFAHKYTIPGLDTSWTVRSRLIKHYTTPEKAIF